MSAALSAAERALLESWCQRAREQTGALLALAARELGARLAAPEIRFDLRGQAAGQVRLLAHGVGIIRYHPQLLLRHGERFIARIVPHETAHLVAFRLFGAGIRPHGLEWRRIMQTFGAEPDRCHRFDVSGLQTRHLRRFGYHCDCANHHLTSIRHRRISRGLRYLCVKCATPLRPGTHPRRLGATGSGDGANTGSCAG